MRDRSIKLARIGLILQTGDRGFRTFGLTNVNSTFAVDSTYMIINLVFSEKRRKDRTELESLREELRSKEKVRQR